MTAEPIAPAPLPVPGRGGSSAPAGPHLRLVPTTPDPAPPAATAGTPATTPTSTPAPTPAGPRRDEASPPLGPDEALPPVVPPGTPWRAAAAAYAREPAWQLALAHAWAVLLGPVLVLLPATAAIRTATALVLATAVLWLAAVVRDLADLRGWGRVVGAGATGRMVWHLATKGPWGYLAVRGRRTGEWSPFLACTATWLAAAVTTGTALFLHG